MTQQEHNDVIIIGAGAAGLSAGLVLARVQADVLLIDAGEPRNACAVEMHGFISRDGVTPADFLAIARREVSSCGATVLPASVRTIEPVADGSFTVTLNAGSAVSARALLIATGLTDELPLIPGVRDRWGTLVHHCPYCHGFEVLNKAIVVIGGPAREMSRKQAGLLRRFSNRVTFAANGIELTETERYRLEAFGITWSRARVPTWSARRGPSTLSRWQMEQRSNAKRRLSPHASNPMMSSFEPSAAKSI